MNAIDYIKENWTTCLTWPDGRVAEWFAWYVQRGLAGCVIGHDGNLNGIALARCVRDVKDGYYVHDESAPILFVDLTIATHPQAINTFSDILVRRFGMRSKVAFKRKKYSGRVSVFPYMKFIKTLKAGASYG